MLKKSFVCMVAALASTIFALGAHAAEPTPKALNFQPAATDIMARVHSFHDLLLWIIIPISVFVLALLLIIAVRFNRKANPTPSKTTHNTLLEVVWTAVPVLILIVIALESFPLLTYEGETPEADMTIKAIGNQWNWTYEYPDHGNFAFTAVIVSDENLKPGQKRLLETDNRVVVPVNTTVKVLVTASDVLHSWAVPSFGIKIDAIPGRLNETWFRVEKEGVYYGQCSELCGIDHGFMPIAIEVVSQEKFDAWVAKAQELYADAGPERPIQIASAN